MSTQRRDGRSTPATEIGRRSLRHGSRLAHCKDRANRAIRSELADAVLNPRSFPAYASSETTHLPAIAARNTLQQDTRNQQNVRSFCPGSPPLGRAAGLSPLRLIGYRLFGYPAIPSPAVFARIHPTLPDVPAARHGGLCRTERYDGKGNLYFKHAA